MLGVATLRVNATFLLLLIAAFLLSRVVSNTPSLSKVAPFWLGVTTTTVNAPFLTLPIAAFLLSRLVPHTPSL